jgi:hypothetical protein
MFVWTLPGSTVLNANLGPCPTNPDSQRVAQAFGYTPEELQSVPAEAHMGLSCGNPVAVATLREV